MDENEKGLYDKYIVEKADGTPRDPLACYFVLRYDKDPNARSAMARYADCVRSVNPKLADDILAALDRTEAVFAEHVRNGTCWFDRPRVDRLPGPG